MPKVIQNIEVLPPARDLAAVRDRLASRRLDLERKESEFASATATLERLRVKEHLLSSELRGAVSSSKYPQAELDRLNSFADRLIRENIQKQAKPDIVARNILRTSRILGNLPRATYSSKRFDTAYRPARRIDVSPRTVFGTDAWIRSAYSMRKKFITQVLALPCVERSVRREVMFAKQKGGKGYRVSHRMSKFSDIWC